MLINYTDNDQWKEETKSLLRQTENADYDPHVHDDGKGIPTLGYGLALVFNNDGWKALSNDQFENLGLDAPDPQTRDILDRIAAAQNRDDTAEARRLTVALTGENSSWTVPQGSDLLDSLLDQSVEQAGMT